MDLADSSILRVCFFQLDPPNAFLLAYEGQTPTERLRAALRERLQYNLEVKRIAASSSIIGHMAHSFPEALRRWFTNKSEPFTDSKSGLRINVLLTDEWTPWRLREPFMSHEPTTRVMNAVCREIVNAALDRPQNMDSWFWKPFIDEQIKVLQEGTVCHLEDPTLVRVGSLMTLGDLADVSTSLDECLQYGMQPKNDKHLVSWWHGNRGMKSWTRTELSTLISDLKQLTSGTSSSEINVSTKLVNLWFRDADTNEVARDFQREFVDMYRMHKAGGRTHKLSAFAQYMLHRRSAEIFAWAAEYEYGMGDRILSTREADFLVRVVKLVPPRPEVEGRIKILTRSGRVLSEL